MRPDIRDASYLWDMVESAKSIREFTAGINTHQYLEDRKLQLAVERLVEIIGEAGGRVSKAFREAHSEIPWRSIIGQRNVLAHEYGDIQQERMWNVVTQRIPELISLLEQLDIPNPPDDLESE